MPVPRRSPVSSAAARATLLLWAVLGGDVGLARAASTPAAVALATQRDLPAFAARSASAVARDEAARAFFAGERGFDTAFPTLQDTPLWDGGFLAGWLAALDARGRLRAAERVAPAPEGLEGRELRAWLLARERACADEERADEGWRRLAFALRAGLDRAPGLAEAQVQPLRAGWRGHRAAVEAMDAEDPGLPAALALAAAAGEAEAGLQGLRRAALLAAVVPGDPSLDRAVWASLALLPADAPQDPPARLRREATLEGLRRVRPLLSGAVAREVDRGLADEERTRLHARRAELQAALAAPPPPPVADGDPEGLARRITQARAAEAAAEKAAEEAAAKRPPEAADSGIALLRAEVAALELQVARRAREDLDARVAAVQASEADRAAFALREAERAREEAMRLGGGSVDAARLLAEAQAVMADSAARHARAEGEYVALRLRFDAARTAGAQAMALPPLDPARPVAVDAAYGQVRAVLADVRRLVDLHGEDRRAVEQARRAQAAGQAAPASPDPEWQAARAALEQAQAAGLSTRHQDLTAALDLLSEAKATRRLLRPEATAQARREARRTFARELRHELVELPLVLGRRVERSRLALAGLPAALGDVTVLGRAVRLTVLGAVGLVAWAWLRRRAQGWDRPLTDALLGGGSIDRAQRAAVKALLRRGVDIALLLLLLFLLPGWPLASLVLLPMLAYGVHRAWPRLVEATVAEADETRAALLFVGPGTRRRLVGTLRAATAWLLLRAWVASLALGLLDADRLAELLDWLIRLGGWGLLCWVLWRWAPVLHEVLRRDPDPDRMVRFLVARQAGFEGRGPMRLPLALAALGLLALRLSRDLVGRMVRRRQRSLSWLGSALDRRELADPVESVPQDPVAERALLARLEAALDGRPADMALPPREEELTCLRRAFAACGVEGSRGLVAVVGDAGSGRSLVARRFVEGAALPMRWTTAEARADGPGALAWLGGALGLGSEGDPGALQEALGTLEPSILVVDDVHRLVLREVGGFDGLRAVLDLAQATSDRHFWLLTCHEATWDLVGGLRSRLALGGFREVIRLGPLSADVLRTWLHGRAQEAEIALSWDRLARTFAGQAAVDRARAARRAEAAWWRLLADSSGGNPRIARALFDAAVRAGDGPGQARLAALAAPGTERLQTQGEAALFTLAAIVVHDWITEAELLSILNMPEQQVRSATRSLQDLGVLGREPRGGLTVRARWRPAVYQLLDQRHLLHRT